MKIINVNRSINIYIESVPGAKVRYEEHLKEYGEVISHSFFCMDFAYPLTELLVAEQEKGQIRKYCDVLQKMWKYGDDQVKNIVDISILPVLEDNKLAWKNIGKYLSDEFIDYINQEPPFIDKHAFEEDLYRSITSKLGITIEEYAEKLHQYLDRTDLTENDNPIPGIPDTTVLSEEEIRFMTKYVTTFEL